MAVMFFVIAIVLYKSGNVLLYRLKDFFSAKRIYMEGNVMENSGEMTNVFLLTTVSALSLSLLLFVVDNLDHIFNAAVEHMTDFRKNFHIDWLVFSHLRHCIRGDTRLFSQSRSIDVFVNH